MTRQRGDELGVTEGDHSDDMLGRDYLIHHSPDGLVPSDRIDRTGHSCWKSSYISLAENIAIEIASGKFDQVARAAFWVGSKACVTIPTCWDVSTVNLVSVRY